MSSKMPTRGEMALAWARKSWLASLVLGLYLITTGVASAVAPPVGTSIGNQATATYVDGTGTIQRVSSNQVSTMVAQVAALAFTPSYEKLGAPGQWVYFPHILTNKGNGPDEFTIDTAGWFTAGTPALAPEDVKMYLDSDKNGEADTPSSPMTPAAGIYTTPTVAMGDSIGLILAVKISATATATQNGTYTFKAASVFDSNVQSANLTDKVTVSTTAVVNVTKTMDVVSGPSPNTNGGAHIKVTMEVNNPSSQKAYDVTLTDTLNNTQVNGKGMTYAAAGYWSSASGTQLTDEAGNDPTGINYTAASNLVTAVIDEIDAGATQTVTFYVDIDSGIPTGTTLNNDVDYTWAIADGGGTTAGSSNIATYTVGGPPPGYGVDVHSTTSWTSPVLAQNETAAIAGTTTASAAQGSKITFTTYVHNTGTGEDTFNFTVPAVGTADNTFPADTQFTVLKNGAPLLDTNGDGTPDVGLVPGTSDSASPSYATVTVEAQLPAGASGDNSGAGYIVRFQTASVHTPAASGKYLTDYITYKLTTITAASVDLSLDGTIGSGADDDVVKQNQAGVEGQCNSFPIVVDNNGGTADNFDLTLKTATALPTDWTLKFYNSSNVEVTNTGNVPIATPATYTAKVCLPATTVSAGTYDIRLQAKSPNTQVLDTIHYTVTVAANVNLVVTSNLSSQVTSGGALVYTHTVTNNGNVTINGTNAAVLSVANTSTSFSALVYRDANGDGVFQASEETSPIARKEGASTAVDGTLGALLGGATPANDLAAGASIKFFVKVLANNGLAVGTINTTTVTFAAVTAATVTETDTSNNAVADTTTVQDDGVRLSKFQQLDSNCDGTETFPSTDDTNAALLAYKAAILNAKPGECIIYLITARNIKANTVNDVTITDNIPAYTTYHGGVGSSGLTTTATAPAVGSTGTVTAGGAAADDLNAGATATMTFRVKINPIPTN